jgi:hypothetical protein
MTDPNLLWDEVALEANRVSHASGQGEQAGPPLSARALAIAGIDTAAKLPRYLAKPPKPDHGASKYGNVAGADEMSAPTVTSNCPCWSKDGFFRDNPDYVKKDQSLPECRPRDTLFKSIFLPQPTKIWMRWRKSLPELGSNWTEVIALSASTQSSGGMSCVEWRALRRDMLLSKLVASSFSPMYRCRARAREAGSGRRTETLWPSWPGLESGSCRETCI